MRMQVLKENDFSVMGNIYVFTELFMYQIILLGHLKYVNIPFQL